MNKERFDKIAATIFSDCVGTLQAGGNEYANDEDRLISFNELASELNIAPAQIAYIYFKKHVKGIAKYIADGKEQRDSIEGRIVDAINYLVLIAALVRDRPSEQKP